MKKRKMKKQKMKKCLCAGFLAILMVFMAGCAHTEEGVRTTSSGSAGTQTANTGETESDSDELAEKISVTGMAWLSPQGGDNTTSYGWSEYEKISNIHVEWENVPDDVVNERKSTVMASGQLPDIFWGVSFSNADLVRYGSQGQIIPLEDLIDQYAENLSALMEEYPEIRKTITMPDGHIYGLPYMKMGDNVRIMEMYVNEDWLKNLNLDYPETLDEFTDMLRAFRDQDANGNGDPSDEIPLSFRKSHLIQTMMSFFSLGTRGTASQQLLDYDEKAQAIRFMPISEEYRQMLIYLNMLYEEKLLDNDVFTMTSSRDIVAKLTQDIVGVHADYTTNAGAGMQDKFLAMPVFENYYGEKMWNRFLPMVESSAPFVISSKCEYPEEMVKWADYFYSPEGQIMYNMGFEGVTFEYDEDGQIKYTEELLNNPEGLTLTQARAQYINFQNGPGIMSDEYFSGAETYWTAKEGLSYYLDYVPKEVWPAFNYTYEENEELIALQSDISSYVDEMTAAFITGREDLANWDQYVQEFKEMGLARYMELVQSGYERYSRN